MKIFVHKSFVFSLIVVILFSSPNFLTAQQKLMGDLSVTKNSPEGFVTVNGEQVLTGRSIASPSLITTSPQASCKVSLAKTGTISISPDSKVNLSFINSSISMDIVSGEFTVETVPGTSFNIFTPDGSLTLPSEIQANVVKIKLINDKTQLQTLVGSVRFNNVVVSAGETYPAASSPNSNKPVEKADDSGKSKGFNPILIVGLLGAVGAVALIVLSASGNKDSTVVSPSR